MVEEEKIENSETEFQNCLSIDKHDKLSEYCDDFDCKSMLKEVLENLWNGENLQLLAHLARSGPGYVRCESLGIYIVTKELFDKLCPLEKRVEEK